MFGLILAGLYVAYSVVFNNVQLTPAVESTLGFLWWWHIAFSCVGLLIGLLIPLIGSLIAIGGKGKERAAGAAVVLASPIILVLILFAQILFLGGVYAVDNGIENGEVVNQGSVIVGAALYGFAILMRLFNRVNSKSD